MEVLHGRGCFDASHEPMISKVSLTVENKMTPCIIIKMLDGYF